MPYLTPQELPEGDDCRPLSIPADTEWLALFGGALTELTKVWNWEDSGGLAVSETVAKMEEIIANWYTVPCAACMTPGGYRTVRIGNDGHLEQLDENGDWQPATDEYYIPPPEAREGGTEQDQICLAAANAVNVYKQLYESLSESWGGAVDEAEALTALIGVMVSVIGFAFAPIVYGIYAFLLPVFGVLYTALEYATADLWDEDVSDTLECFLFNCATNTDGVVTFDWQCFIDQLNARTNPFDLTEVQIRFYLQMIYLLYFTGGVDGLNLAGGTTEITESDCPCVCTITLEESCGYGVVENIGGDRWRITSGPTGGGNHSVCVTSVVDPRCWKYSNYTITGGAITYADGTNCDDDYRFGMPGSCDASNITGISDDIVGIFIQSSIGSFVIEMDVVCGDEC